MFARYTIRTIVLPLAAIAGILIFTVLLASRSVALPVDEALLDAIGKADLAEIRRLIQEGAALAPAGDEPPLAAAVRAGNVDVVAELVLAGAPLEAADAAGRTPLMIASELGNKPVVLLLLEAGADANADDPSGRNVFSYARGNDKIESILRQYGATPKVSPQEGAALKDIALSPKRYQEVTVYYGTNRRMNEHPSGPASVFGSTPDTKVNYGYCSVTIPLDHRVGEIESPSFLKRQFDPDPNVHVVLRNVASLNREDFYRRISESKSTDILLFIHGFNNSFEYAAKRTAQMSYDLKFPGVAMFYSWPSGESLFRYKEDRAVITASLPHLKSFLSDVAGKYRDRNIYVIAHSMGTYGFTEAVAGIARERGSGDRMFKQIILAAPDIDADVFNASIAPYVVPTAERFTVYASANDAALAVSNYVNGSSSRLGQARPTVTVYRGIETIDASDVDTSLVGHAYFGESSSIITDIYALIRGYKPGDRSWLSGRRTSDNSFYWYFLAQ